MKLLNDDRYAKVTDAQVLSRLLDICDMENVVKTDDGLEAVIFTAQGDMRQAINNLQATHQVYSFSELSGEHLHSTLCLPISSIENFIQNSVTNNNNKLL